MHCIGGTRSDHFLVSTGLRRGCVLSPWFFSLYINSLVVELKHALGSLLLRAQSAVGLLFGHAFRKLYDIMVQSVLLYGCLRCLESLEQVKLRAFQSYFSVPRSHTRTSLLAEMEMLSVGWEARIRCIGFWHRLLTDHQFHHHVIQRLAYAALVNLRRGQWVGKLRTCFEVFGWQDCATLAGVLGG